MVEMMKGSKIEYRCTRHYI